MSMKVEIEPNISLQQVKNEMQSGTSVMRSAHVGNLRGYNLAIAQMEIPLLLVDHNKVIQTPSDRDLIAGGDANYLAGSIVTREKVMPLKVSQLGGLSLRTEVTHPETGGLQFVDELHVSAIKEVFPATSVVTDTEYLRSQIDLAGEAVAIALQNYPELFKRVVEADGTVRTTTQAPMLYEKYGILQLNDDPKTERGVLIPNDVDIVINFIIECIRSERSTQIHLSGPDMVQYLKGSASRDQLAALYNTIHTEASFGTQLPEDIVIKLVPTAEARFVSTEPYALAIEKLFQLLEEKDALRNERATFFKSESAKDTNKKAPFLQKCKQEESRIDNILTTALTDASEIFQDSQAAPFVSQYDLLQGDTLVTLQQNINLTMHELKMVTNALSKIRRDTP
ncbi:hypothetical protein KDA08_05835 [Candidatus Saccharibacteria bacterium]|nr:hypothetical protein [Candidatus Saccharibacteria bacterium]